MTIPTEIQRSPILALLCATAIAFSAVGSEREDGFTPLFNGKDLTGWHTTPGGSWEVVDGVVVGKSPVTETRHGLLVSDKSYRDFAVRFNFKVVKGNSGFYFRSEEKPGTAVGVHGFQAEVEHGYLTGGLYETGGRTWVVKVDEEVMKKHYRPGEWNRMGVTAVGGQIVVRVNGFKSAELKDDPGRSEGHFALQLHGKQDMHVEYKDVRLKKLSE
ncbi:MAG: 3-keto-disaccharide hydrolase [Planctomycetota bacterium]|jgi:hypothetical protein